MSKADARLIPSGIRDDSTLAMNDLIDRLGTIDITPLLVYLIDHVSPSALAHLAEQLSVTGLEGWAFATTDAERRLLLKTAIDNHRHKGTPYAVRRAIDALGMTGRIQEWWQYGGAPYRFKMEIMTNGVEMDDRRRLLTEQLIMKYKNARSWLELITYLTGVTGVTPVYNTGLVAHETLTLFG